MEFKEKLKNLRKEKGLSQQALADSIFISRSAVAKWENGLGLPSEESMNALLNFFDVPREYFATDQPEEVLIQKNKLIRKIATVLAVSVAVLGLMIALLFLSIPAVNDLTAAQIKTKLERLPLPESSVQIESLSNAGKMTGNGNGMQYCGTLLLRSHLTEEEIREHYSRSPRPNTILIVRPVSDSEMPPFAYCLELWHGGFVSGWDPLLNLDFRGH